MYAIRSYYGLSYAQAACNALHTAMQQDARVVTLGEDVGRGGRNNFV